MIETIGIISTGFYVPSKTVTNKDLSKMVDTSDEWIYTKTGVRERRIADPHEATSDLAIFAALDALKNAKMHAEDIDLIILATSTPDMIQPSTASIVQGKLGACNAAAFDISAVCSGFVFALTVAYSMLKSIPQFNTALVIGSETYSRILDWNDRKTCVFFGDGAGAVVLGSVPPGNGIINTYLMNDGRGANVIKFLGGGSRYPASGETIQKNMHKFEMQGKQVWDFATSVCPIAVRKVVEAAGDQLEDIDLLISHQANINIIKSCMNTLKLPMDKTYTNIERYGNTSGASIPIALAEAHQTGIIKPQDKIVLVGFGGGLSYGSVYMKWGF